MCHQFITISHLLKSGAGIFFRGQKIWLNFSIDFFISFISHNSIKKLSTHLRVTNTRLCSKLLGMACLYELSPLNLNPPCLAAGDAKRTAEGEGVRTEERAATEDVKEKECRDSSSPEETQGKLSAAHSWVREML